MVSAISYQMSRDAKVFPLVALGGTVTGDPGLKDIGGTNATTAWVPAADFTRFFAFVQIGTWNGSDDLDECRLEQAQDADGTNPKDLTTDASGGNYDTDAPIDAAGNFVVLEATVEDLDRDNNYTHVRLYVAEGGNTGVDSVLGLLIAYGAHIKKAQLQGAAATGEQVYVTPS